MEQVQAGTSRYMTLGPTASGLTGIGIRVEDTTDTVVVARTTSPAAREFAEGYYDRQITFLSSLTPGVYRVVWDHADFGEAVEEIKVTLGAPTPTGPGFATAQDVSDRLGRGLTDPEETTAESVIITVTGLIAATLDQGADWEADLDPVPAYFKALCVEKSIGTIANPSNLAAESEQLGAYQHSQTFPRSLDVGVFLTKDERREVRRAADRASLGAVEYETWAQEEASDLDFEFPLET